MQIYPQGKEIILIRDFRDVACSVLAFNNKRGTEGFCRQKLKSDDKYVRKVIKNTGFSLQDRWKKRKKQAHLVRYED